MSSSFSSCSFSNRLHKYIQDVFSLSSSLFFYEELARNLEGADEQQMALCVLGREGKDNRLTRPRMVRGKFSSVKKESNRKTHKWSEAHGENTNTARPLILKKKLK